MVRTRLAFLALASSFLLTSGCASPSTSQSQSGGWFSRFCKTSKTKTEPPCPCEDETMFPHGDTSIMAPDAFVSPNEFVPPNVFGSPPNTCVPPNAFVPGPPTVIPSPPTGSQPPRIITVPQANPIPYAP
jgi:hypothetical protein